MTTESSPLGGGQRTSIKDGRTCAAGNTNMAVLYGAEVDLAVLTLSSSFLPDLPAAPVWHVAVALRLA